MEHFVVLAVMLVLFSGSALGQFVMPGPPDACISSDLLHKPSPSAESETLEACGSWQSLSCCTADTARSIDRYMALRLYNFSWELCEPLSQECQNYMENEVCFYECEPMLGYFSDSSPAVHNVPVCASYCNRWFEACKSDMTCVDNWRMSFDQAFAEGSNTCPPDQQCMTFEELFENGSGLCNRLWGESFVYSEDEDNCTVMAFDPDQPNPNFQLSFESAGHQVEASIIAMAIVALVWSL